MDDPRLKKLKFRAWHRGFREADLILGPFADSHLEQLSPEQLDAFEQLIDQPDPDLYGWIVGSSPTPEAFEGEVLDLIRGFRFFAHAAFGADHGG
jgi:antitoxin CptB